MAKHIGVKRSIDRWPASLVACFIHLCVLISCLEDTITLNQQIRDGDGQTIVSAGRMFELGFFSPQGSNDRYVGIWYYDLQPQTVVWVANREIPLTFSDNGGVLTLRNDGNLVILGGRGRKIVWSTNTSIQTNSTAKLEDSGNLILRGLTSTDQKILWQSFEHPTDTLLEDMILKNSSISSWSNFSVPSPGSFAFEIDVSQPPWQLLISRGSDIYWKSNWTGSVFEGIPRADELFYIPVRSMDDGNFTYSSIYKRTRLVMDMNGQIKFFIFDDRATQWTLVWWIPKEECNIYAVCGVYSICTDMNYSSSCSCLPGFQPALPKDWKAGNKSGGCTRKKTSLYSEEEEGFLYFKVKTRQKSFEPLDTEDCRKLCKTDSSCTAYIDSTGCQISHSDLMDLRASNVEDTNVEESSDFFIRLPASEIPITQRVCEKCGTIAIPYPLSTGPNCGDPSYRSFTCDNFTGQLSFNTLNKSYQVINISAETRTFVINPMTDNYNDNPECNNLPSVEHEMQLDPSLPFNLTTNNIILMLNCSSPVALNCNRSSICTEFKEYINKTEAKQQEGGQQDVGQQAGRPQDGQPQCSLQNVSCCSYVAGGSSSTSHMISLSSSTGCTMYKSLLNKSLGLPLRSWLDEVEVAWELPAEPFCDLSKNCEDWPNSTCKLDKTTIGRKRCFCDAGLHWDNQAGYCIQLRDKISHSISKQLLTIIVVVSTVIGILSLGSFICLWRRMYNRKDLRMAEDILNNDNFRENEKKDIDVPFFDFTSIAVATSNFSDSNMLGEGGFGLVYKGTLPGGQEIAVKRLSRSSGQGLEEFKNEVLLIAKLQHRNLVKLVGYCIQGDEKMLLYEYMPNKSLDYFLFDQNRRSLLDWEMRLSIILGIARGLLYLHQDSRLRIIHRDLKASNVLLDEEMNPKISDFGLARMFGGNQTEANTNRVVGTYGYMSPEYALDGLFSVKSDVFSFGVLLLEIISGRKNTGFYHSEHSLSLLGHAWRLWREEKGLELMDPLLNKANNVQDVLKCIHVGLLCVQEDATDRPTMATVVVMLVSETASLPTPKQPAFYIRRKVSSVGSSSSGPETCSNNEITITNMEGR